MHFDQEYAESRKINGVSVIIRLEKLGGGTRGRSYAGTWRYRVQYLNGEIMTQGQDLITGTPKTHAQVASILADFLETGE